MTKRQTKRLIHLALTLLLIAASWYVSTHRQAVERVVPPTGTYRVTQVDDGDTIQVDMSGTLETIRFIGVDTPEIHDPRKPIQCFGHAASDFTKNLIGDQPVKLEADPTNTNRDRYNRLLRYVYLPDGRLVNAEIIKEGYGFAYVSFPFEKMEEFRQHQRQARKADRGLWSGCEPTKNEFGGYTSNPAN